MAVRIDENSPRVGRDGGQVLDGADDLDGKAMRGRVDLESTARVLEDFRRCDGLVAQGGGGPCDGVGFPCRVRDENSVIVRFGQPGNGDMAVRGGDAALPGLDGQDATVVGLEQECVGSPRRPDKAADAPTTHVFVI